jgi:hypothetical protein
MSSALLVKEQRMARERERAWLLQRERERESFLHPELVLSVTEVKDSV